jgi:hypothetical protein
MRRAPILALFTLCLLTLSTTQARADTVVVTGTASVTRVPGPIGLSFSASLSGPGFSASLAGAESGGVVPGVNCSFISGGWTGGGLSTSFSGADIFGTFTIDGTTFNIRGNFGPGATLNIAAPGFTIPAELFGAPGLLVTAPFTLNGLALPSTPGFPAEVNFTGSGTVRALLMRCNNDLFHPCFAIDRVDYVFGQSTQGVAVTPTPEPATLLLLGTGLAGVVGAARKRRKAAGGGNS